MTRFLVSILISILFASGIYGQNFSPIFTDKLALQESKHVKLKSSFTESRNASETDFIHQRMDWKIDPAVRFISGKITTRFISKINNLSEIYFDLNDVMQVDSVKHGKKQIPFLRKNHKLIATLETPLNENDLDSVSVFYQGTPAENDFGAFIRDNHGQEATPIIWTLSEPYGAMDWWPCKQSLADKIDSIDVIVTSPEAYKTASNGVLISNQITNGKRTMHWKHRFPIATYLVAIAVTNYSNYSDFAELDDGRKIEILNYVYPEKLDEAKAATPRTIEIMKLYNQLIGEYPFAGEKYGHAQFGWSGGMEHQTMSFMGNFGFGLIAHELAHQWFGDYITLGSWHDIWLNEGFATYLTGLSYEHISTLWWPVWKKLKIEHITSEPSGSVYVNDTTDIRRIFNSRLSYSKGAYLLHMLRWILGDDTFFTAIRNYFNDPQIANGFATTKQLIQHFETTADTSLTEFFNDWYYGEGYPIYSAKYWHAPNDQLIISLSQNTSNASVNFFEMPVPVRLYNSDMTDSLDVRLNHTQNEQEFSINPGFKVGEIKIDPDLWLVSKTETLTGIPLPLPDHNIVIYPNPVREKINVQLPLEQKIILVKIYTLHGFLVANYNNTASTIPAKDLPAGAYILKTETSNQVFRKIFIKQ